MNSTPHLTEREQQTLALLASGRSCKEAAKDMNISPKTAEKHRQNAFQKIHVRDAVMATHWAIAHGLVPLAFSIPVQVKEVRA